MQTRYLLFLIALFATGCMSSNRHYGPFAKVSSRTNPAPYTLRVDMSLLSWNEEPEKEEADEEPEEEVNEESESSESDEEADQKPEKGYEFRMRNREDLESALVKDLKAIYASERVLSSGTTDGTADLILVPFGAQHISFQEREWNNPYLSVLTWAFVGGLPVRADSKYIANVDLKFAVLTPDLWASLRPILGVGERLDGEAAKAIEGMVASAGQVASENLSSLFKEVPAVADKDVSDRVKLHQFVGAGFPGVPSGCELPVIQVKLDEVQLLFTERTNVGFWSGFLGLTPWYFFMDDRERTDESLSDAVVKSAAAQIATSLRDSDNFRAWERRSLSSLEIERKGNAIQIKIFATDPITGITLSRGGDLKLFPGSGAERDTTSNLYLAQLDFGLGDIDPSAGNDFFRVEIQLNRGGEKVEATKTVRLRLSALD